MTFFYRFSSRGVEEKVVQDGDGHYGREGPGPHLSSSRGAYASIFIVIVIVIDNILNKMAPLTVMWIRSASAFFWIQDV